MLRKLGVASIAAIAVLTIFTFAAPGARAGLTVFTAALDGPSENPPNASPGTGTATVIYDDVLHELIVQVSFSGLVSTTTVAHIHCCVAPPGNIGVATFPGTFPGFPVGATTGSYDNSLFPIDLTEAASYTASFLTNFGGGTVAGAEAALVAGLFAGEAYFNIHTILFPGGEIRGFLQFVPEPGMLGLFGLGVVGALAMARRRARLSP